MRTYAQPEAVTPVIAWEECACLLCGSPRRTPILEAAEAEQRLRFLIVRCDRCGLCFTNPRPNADSIRAFYPLDYRCHHAKTPSARVDPLTRYLQPFGRRRLLDFGCGGGDFLARMHALGWDVVGLDLFPGAVARVQERGLNAHVGTLPRFDWPSESFDAITMRQSLEHVHQPLDVLGAAHRLLAPGGRLIVTTPNFDSFASRWFGPAWYGLDLPRHLVHFTPMTLGLMLEHVGFAHIDLRQEQHRSWIRHSAARASGWTACFLQTRVGAGVAGTWGWLIGRSEGIAAFAVK